MEKKVDILIHPVRMKIIRTLMGNEEKGLTPLEMAKKMKDVPQATLYRHIQVLVEAKIISILKEKKVRSVSEKYYVLNLEEASLKNNEWQYISNEDKLQYFTYYQLSLMNQYEDYLNKLEERTEPNDGAAFSAIELNLGDQQFESFQTELQNLLIKYYNDENDNKEDTQKRSIGITIIPEG